MQRIIRVPVRYGIQVTIPSPADIIGFTGDCIVIVTPTATDTARQTIVPILVDMQQETSVPDGFRHIMTHEHIALFTR
jgi:hypothetical protein